MNSAAARIRIAILLIILFPVALYPQQETTVSFAAIQLEISDEACRSVASFESQVRDVFERSYRPGLDLIVFPEYTSALLGISLHFGYAISLSETLAEFLGVVSAISGMPVVRSSDEQTREAGKNSIDVGAPPRGVFGDAVSGLDREEMAGIVALVPRLLRKTAESTRRRMDSFWGRLARQYDVAVVAGTYFAVAEDGSLRNRAVVYDTRGDILYEQDKVYLTPFERILLRAEPGAIVEAAPFPVDGADVALTICRDTFFESWESQLADSDLWIDLKANGTEYDEAEAQRFRTALPERISATAVPTGATVCLTGTLLDFFWEGRSSIVEYDPIHGYRVRAKAPVFDRHATMYSDPRIDVHSDR